MGSSALILGGAGFVGTRLVDNLTRQSVNRVHVVDRMVHASSKKFIRDFSDEVTVEDFDVRDTNRLIGTLRRMDFDVIYHLAANSDIRNSESGAADLSDTLGTTVSICEALKTKRVPKLIFASSSAVFGEVSGKISTDYDSRNSLIPISNYGMTKLASEYVLKTSFNEGNIKNLKIVRFPNVVGGNSTHGILYDFFNKKAENPSVLEVLGNGSQTKPYILVDQLVEVLIEISSLSESSITSDHSQGLDILNVSPPNRISVREIVDIFLRENNWCPRVVFGETPDGWPGDVNSYEFEANYYSERLMSSSEAIVSAIRVMKSQHNES